MIDVTPGMLSACAPLSCRCGYPVMAAHCHGDSLRGRTRAGSLNVRFIRSEFTVCSALPEVRAGWSQQQDNEAIVNEAANQR